MTELTFRETVDVVLSYLVKENSNEFGLCAVGGVLLQVASAAKIDCVANVAKWNRKIVLSVLDSLAFNGISADTVDNRDGHQSYFAKLLCEAKDLAGLSLYGEVNVGEYTCVVSAKQRLYFGRDIEAYGGLGMCAERVALMQAFSRYNSSVQFILTCDSDGKIRRPCGACLEFMDQGGLQDTWIAMEEGLWVPMRKVGWYASFH